MGLGAVIEPLVVVSLLFGGTWINRETYLPGSLSRQLTPAWRRACAKHDSDDADSLEAGMSTDADEGAGAQLRAVSPSLLLHDEESWRTRTVGIGPWKFEVSSPHSEVFRWRLLSRVLRWFPFLVECWYWALVYWVRSCFPSLNAFVLTKNRLS
jgi:hypothetical protein